jgi:hypothetical protein
MSGPLLAPQASSRTTPKSLRQDDAARAAASTDEGGAEAKEIAALGKRERTFNFMLEERAEDQREAESLDTLFLAQLKHQDEILKAWLRLAG